MAILTLFLSLLLSQNYIIAQKVMSFVILYVLDTVLDCLFVTEKKVISHGHHQRQDWFIEIFLKSVTSEYILSLPICYR